MKRNVQLNLHKLTNKSKSSTQLPLLWENLWVYLPDMFPVDESQEAELDHVPWGTVLIAHQVQSHGHVGVAVVTAEVMLWEQRQRREELTWLLFLHEKYYTDRHKSTYLPFGAYTPLKRRARLCPKHWSRWHRLCLRPASSTFNPGEGHGGLVYLQGNGAHRISDRSCAPLWGYTPPSLTLLVFQMPCCLPVKRKTGLFRAKFNF